MFYKLPEHTFIAFMQVLESFSKSKCSFQYGSIVLYDPVHEISHNIVCATSKASDQPAHMRNLIRAFACRLSILQLLSY